MPRLDIAILSSFSPRDDAVLASNVLGSPLRELAGAAAPPMAILAGLVFVSLLVLAAWTPRARPEWLMRWLLCFAASAWVLEEMDRAVNHPLLTPVRFVNAVVVLALAAATFARHLTRPRGGGPNLPGGSGY
jgi:hypothetical protein